jgi:hypothetical protein
VRNLGKGERSESFVSVVMLGCALPTPGMSNRDHRGCIRARCTSKLSIVRNELKSTMIRIFVESYDDVDCAKIAR